MAVRALWSRALNLGRAASPLEADLQRITEPELIDVPPQDALLHVTQASHDPEERRIIMRHLQDCLGESVGKRWRRIHGGMVLLEQLLQQGSSAVTSEVAQGLHFDPVQRLTFLERFDYVDDRRVQQMVRQKATALRADLISRLLAAADGPASGAAAPAASASSSCATAGAGLSGRAAASCAGGAFVGFGSDSLGGPGAAVTGAPSKLVGFGSDDGGAAAFVPNGQAGNRRGLLVNGVVSVGHRDDTTDESSGGEGAVPGRRDGGSKDRKALPRHAGSGGPVAGAGRRRVLEESTDSDSDSSHGRQPLERRPPPAARPREAPRPAQADLLGGSDSPAAGQQAPRTAVAEDLLDGLLDVGSPPPPGKAPVPADNLLDL